jgi:hypothetical protein
MKPKKVAPVENKMRAVFTGLGQRSTLLTPLTNMRHPSITRRTASAKSTRFVGSNLYSQRDFGEMTGL